MRIKYPVSMIYAVALSMAICALTVVWNPLHAAGLFVAVGAVFGLPRIARWEGARRGAVR